MFRKPLSKFALLVALACGVALTSGANWPAPDNCCCEACCCPCPPPPVKMVVCLQDPCNCCTYEACVCVPACCAGIQPCVTWRGGIAGRQVATLCWDCCGHEAKVVVSRRGNVRVRG